LQQPGGTQEKVQYGSHYQDQEDEKSIPVEAPVAIFEVRRQESSQDVRSIEREYRYQVEDGEQQVYTDSIITEIEEGLSKSPWPGPQRDREMKQDTDDQESNGQKDIAQRSRKGDLHFIAPRFAKECGVDGHGFCPCYKEGGVAY